MGAVFFEGRSVPTSVRRSLNGYNGYGRFGDDAADIFQSLTSGAASIAKSISPWDFLTGIFVNKPEAEAAAQVALSQQQAQAYAEQQEARAKIIKTALIAGAGVVGVLVIAVVLKKHKGSSVAGYRRRRRRR